MLLCLLSVIAAGLVLKAWGAIVRGVSGVGNDVEIVETRSRREAGVLGEEQQDAELTGMYSGSWLSE